MHSPVECGAYFIGALHCLIFSFILHSEFTVVAMASYSLPHIGHVGYGNGPTHFAYNIEDQTERLPSGITFDLDQFEGSGRRPDTWEKGVNPLNVFSTFYSSDNEHVQFYSERLSTPGPSNVPRCLPLLDVDVDVKVQSTISKTQITQTFTNPSNYNIKEANYSFPLYDGSAVISFRCHVGKEKLLEGTIKTREVSPRSTLTD
jgi:hypothetical protein